MVFETRNSNYSTVLSITFMQCCKIVLMAYNTKLNAVFNGGLATVVERF